MTHDYKAWGLIISSELCLPELPEGRGLPDVTVRFGGGPAVLKLPERQLAAYESTPLEFLFRVGNNAEYHVTAGEEVTIIPLREYNEQETKLFLLGSVFGALLQQRGLLTLHGSCVEIGGEGVLITGASGAGKSTLAAVLRKRGHRMLCDDVCAVSMDRRGLPVVYPGCAAPKLERDTALQLGLATEGLLPPLQREDKLRFSIGPDYSEKPSPLCRIFQLSTYDGPQILLSEILGPQRFISVAENTYRGAFLSGMRLESRHFSQCAHVAKSVRIYAVCRPEKPFLPHELAEAVEAVCLPGKPVNGCAVERNISYGGESR